MKINITILFILTIALNVFSQSEKNAVDFNTEFPTIEIKNWVGKRFIFQPQSISLQKYGYQLISNGRGLRLSYQEYVGKTVTVTSVEPSGRTSGSYVVKFLVDETNEPLSALAVNSTVDGVVSLEVIEKARKLFVGKTLWRQSGSFAVYNKDNSVGFNVVSISPFEPLKVTKVEASSDMMAPVRIWLQSSSGLEGFVDVSLGGTNISDILRNRRRFQDELSFVRPKQESAIEANQSFKPSASALALASQGKDVLGWQQGWWGMKESEMLVVYTDAKKLPKRDLYSKRYVDYTIPDYKIGSGIYTVNFQMDTLTNRLGQILIKSEELPKNKIYLSTFQELEGLLTQKYGVPTYKKDDSENKYLVNQTRQWVFPTTTIELTYSFMENISSYVSIRYFPTKSSDANKL